MLEDQLQGLLFRDFSLVAEMEIAEKYTTQCDQSCERGSQGLMKGDLSPLGSISPGSQTSPSNRFQFIHSTNQSANIYSAPAVSYAQCREPRVRRQRRLLPMASNRDEAL